MSSSGQRPAFNDGGGGPVPLNIPAVDASGNVIDYTLENNYSFQSVAPTGISLTGRADPLQGIPRPEGWEYNPDADAQQFGEPVSEGFNITAEDVADTVLDFIPIVGGVKDIYKGIRDGDGWQVALGAGSIVLDIFTGGASSVLKGGIKTGIKAGGRALAKKATKGFKSPTTRFFDDATSSAARGATKLMDYNQARNAAMKWLDARGFKAEKVVLGKFGTSKGKPIGMSSGNRKIGFRVEYDGRSGAHINVWFGKEKGPHFQFDASEETVNQIIKRFSN